MRMVRKSRILNGAERFAGRLRDLFAKSVIVQWMGQAFGHAENAFRSGRLSCLSDAEYDRNAWQYRFRLACLKGEENSLLLHACRCISRYLLETSVRTYGNFGFLYGAFSAALWFLHANRSHISLFLSLILIVVSVPLLHVGRPLAYVIRHSFLVGKCLFDFCGIPAERFASGEQGTDHHWQVLLMAAVLGIAGKWLSPVMLLLGALLLPTLLLLFSVPELSLLLLLFGLPFFNLLPHPTMYLIAAVLFTDLAWVRKAFGGRRRLRFGIVDFCVLLFEILLLCGGAVSAGGHGSLYAGAVMALLLSLWFPAGGLLSSSVWRERTINALCLSCFLCALLGVVQYFFTDLDLRWVDPARFADIGGRVTSVFTNPNILAVYLLLLSPLMLARGMDAKVRPLRRFFYLSAFFTALLCLIFTWSRGAWLGILAAILLFLVCHSRRSFGALLLSVVPALSLLPHLPHNILNRFSSIGSFAESSIRYRFYTWRGVMRLLRDHPWGIGVGTDAFGAVYPKYAVSGTETVMHTHQLFLQITTELGVPGLLVFLTLLVLLILCAARGLRDLHGSSRCLMLGSMCGITGALIMGLFDDIWYHYGLFCLFFIICAVLVLTVTGREEEDIS